MGVGTAIQRHWDRVDAITVLLMPLSLLYGLVVRARAIAYRIGVFKIRQWNVPVLVVGNLTVGGSGKTPLVIKLAQALQARGWRPGVVSRGYGGRVRAATVVTSASDPATVGDEPVLIARMAQVPVVVARKRPDAVDRLLADSKVDLVLSDDGLQHWALGRNVEIALIDETLDRGNGLLLPAGPLRESRSRLSRVELRVRRDAAPGPGEHAMYTTASVARNLLTGEEVSLSSFVGLSLIAVAGIHRPERFFTMLREAGLKAQEMAFPDHHAFVREDLSQDPGQTILMTLKDAVKCESFAQPRWWAVCQEVAISEQLVTEVEQLLRASSDGS